MSTVYLVRTVAGLKAANDDALAALRRIAVGELVQADVRRPRNVKYHRKFFALCHLVFDASGQWESVEHLLTDLKFHLRHVESFRLHDGRQVDVPASISFAAMDDVEFSRFFDRAIRALCELTGGIQEDALREAVLEELSR